MKKQIKIAQKHSDFADQVSKRREEDKAVQERHKIELQIKEDEQRRINNERRMANRQGIMNHKNHILKENSNIRQELKN